MANTSGNETLGSFSLRSAAWGIVLPILAITFLVAFRADFAGSNRTTITWLVGTVFLTFELFAFLSGLGAWSCTAGKLGAFLSLIILVGGLAAGAAVFDWPVPLDRLVSRKAEPAPKPGDRVIREPAPPPAPPHTPAPKAPEPEPPVREKPVRRGSPGELFPNVPPQ